MVLSSYGSNLCPSSPDIGKKIDDARYIQETFII